MHDVQDSQINRPEEAVSCRFSVLNDELVTRLMELQRELKHGPRLLILTVSVGGIGQMIYDSRCSHG